MIETIFYVLKTLLIRDIGAAAACQFFELQLQSVRVQVGEEGLHCQGVEVDDVERGFVSIGLFGVGRESAEHFGKDFAAN